MQALRLYVSGPADAPRTLILRQERVLLGRSSRCDVPLFDDSISREHACIVRVGQGFLVQDLGSANGTFVAGARVERAPLRSGTQLRLGSLEIRVAWGDGPPSAIGPGPGAPSGMTTRVTAFARPGKGTGAGEPRGLIGRSASMCRVRELVKRAATCDLPVLVHGQSGTGKELVAQSISELDLRRRPRLVAVSLPSLDANLASGELFGHRKGTFTGAMEDRKGWFEYADGATLFLDEIGDTSPEVQAKLLRAIDQKEVIPVGARRPVRVDVRVIAATNRPIQRMIRDGTFSEALYYRLAGVEITIDPLRARREDIPVLVDHFSRLATTDGPPACFSQAATEAMAAYDWPGNVRELRHAVEQALVLCGGGEVRPEHLHDRVTGRATQQTEPVPGGIKDAKRAHLLAALRAAGGSQSVVARALGVSRQAVNQMVKRMGITPAEWAG